MPEEVPNTEETRQSEMADPRSLWSTFDIITHSKEMDEMRLPKKGGTKKPEHEEKHRALLDGRIA